MSEEAKLKETAISSLSKGLLAVALFSAVWLVSIAAIKANLRQKAIAEDLVAWNVLRTSIADVINVNRWNLEDKETAAQATDVANPDEALVQTVPIIQSDVEEQKQVIDQLVVELEAETHYDDDATPRRAEIILSTPWPVPAISRARLELTDTPYLYRSAGANLPLPFERYRIFFNHELPRGEEREDEEQPSPPTGPIVLADRYLKYATVVTATDAGGEPWPADADLPHAVRVSNWRLSVDNPRDWLLGLAAFGQVGEGSPGLDALSFKNPEFMRWLEKIRIEKQTILGIPVDPGIFFTAGGLALAALVFPLIGPIVTLRRTRAMPATTVSSLVASLTGPAGRLWNLLRLGAGMLLVLVPPAIALLPFLDAAGINLSLTEQILRALSAFGAAVACLVLLFAVREIRCFAGAHHE